MTKTKPTTMRQVAAHIDSMREALELSDQAITALTVECKALRRKLAEREGDIAELHARIAAAGGRQ